jgi:hypothetical protein
MTPTAAPPARPCPAGPWPRSPAANRPLMPAASRPSAKAEIGRLAEALGQARRQLKDNRARLLAIVDDIAPSLTSRYGVGPVSAAQAIVSFSHPGPVPQRSRLRRPGRHRPAPGQQRPDRPAPARPRRRPGAEPRDPRHRAGPDAQLPPDPRLRRPAHRRGQDHPGDPPLPQALHRPRALPAPHPVDESSGEPLTNIEASEGWGFESLRARPGHRPLPAPGRGLLRASGSHSGSYGGRFGPEQRLAHRGGAGASPAWARGSGKFPGVARYGLPDVRGF